MGRGAALRGGRGRVGKGRWRPPGRPPHSRAPAASRAARPGRRRRPSAGRCPRQPRGLRHRPPPPCWNRAGERGPGWRARPLRQPARPRTRPPRQDTPSAPPALRLAAPPRGPRLRLAPPAWPRPFPSGHAPVLAGHAPGSAPGRWGAVAGAAPEGAARPLRGRQRLRGPSWRNLGALREP